MVRDRPESFWCNGFYPARGQHSTPLHRYALPFKCTPKLFGRFPGRINIIDHNDDMSPYGVTEVCGHRKVNRVTHSFQQPSFFSRGNLRRRAPSIKNHLTAEILLQAFYKCPWEHVLSSRRGHHHKDVVLPP